MDENFVYRMVLHTRKSNFETYKLIYYAINLLLTSHRLQFVTE